MSHRTEGKITYIHERQVPDFSGLDDPALQRQPPPIPVIAIGDQPPLVTRYYGSQPHGDMAEADEFTVWAAPPARRRKAHWPRIALSGILLAIVAITYLFIYLLLAQTWSLWLS